MLKFGKLAGCWLALLLLSSAVLAQVPAGTLHGKVTDPSGAVVAGATVTATSSNGQKANAQTSRQGTYEIRGLAPGNYNIDISASGFALFTQEALEIAAGQNRTLDAPLEIAVEQQQIEVLGEAPTVDVNPENNASQVVIQGKDLDALSDDPDELQQELEALAGPSAGPNGGQMYIDGFTAGQLPPKSAIREIRINQNPFSAEYDKLGFGRIEIFTKPGGGQFHGQFLFNEDNSIFNARNPFVTNELGYQTQQFEGSFSGPINKKASFFFQAQRRDLNDPEIVNATILDPNLNEILYTDSNQNPKTRTNFGPRIDYQVTNNNTLTARYQFYDDEQKNNGIGQFALPTQGYNVNTIEHTFQLTDTQALSSKMVNETRFQFLGERSSTTPQSPAAQATISVQGAFTGGGTNIGNVIDDEDRYELQNYTSIALAKHFLRFGGRLRVSAVSNYTTQNFNSTFTFASLQSYLETEQGLEHGLTIAQIRAQDPLINGITVGPTQYTVTAGQPHVLNTLADAGLYAEDDWKLRPNLTASYGLRFETQNDIHDHADFAPRLGIAWGVGHAKTAPKTVLRAGYGIFYDRFPQNLVVNAEHLNGLSGNEQEFEVNQPNFFPNAPSASALPAGQTFPTVYQISPNLRAPYIMETGTGVEQQVTKYATVSVNLLNSRGLHQLFSDNINAAEPETYNINVPSSGIRPHGNVGNIYQYQSGGIFKQTQLITNFNVRVGVKYSLFGYYTFNFAHSDTSGAGSFPENQYIPSADYGPTTFDVRNKIFLGGTLAAPYGLRFSPLVVANSGQPFNITLGQDDLGTSILNDRPSYGTPGAPGTKTTPFGTFNLAPVAGAAAIPPYLGVGPNQFAVNLRVSKAIGIGKRAEVQAGNGRRGGGGRGGRGGGALGGGGFGGGGRGGPGGGAGGPGGGPGGPGGAGDRRYTLTFSANGRNIFNNVNRGTPIGLLSSPRFDQSNSLAGGVFNTQAANRRIDLQVVLSF